MFETEIDIQHRGKEIKKILKRYPKLTLDITYSDIYRLQKKFKYIKQLPMEGLSNVTITSINDGDIYFVTKKKNGDKNIFYLVPYDKLLNLIFPIMDEDGNERFTKFTATKVTLKPEDESEQDYSTTLESCTKF